jgi:hypothetical protein
MLKDGRLKPLEKKNERKDQTSDIACFQKTECTQNTLNYIMRMLRAERQRDQSSGPGRVKNFNLCISFRPAIGPTQPPIQWLPKAPTITEVKKTWMCTSTPHTSSWSSA